jgi:hypothetical protein
MLGVYWKATEVTDQPDMNGMFSSVVMSMGQENGQEISSFSDHIIYLTIHRSRSCHQEMEGNLKQKDVKWC